ncbi:sialidase family protein [Acinetobacter baumannii]|uniref:sialidase family protein n=1 Tax=Acinetobacter baumannii TaxID=470 RepID=UPI000810402E|nr:sialidase family protein [Acinetobacter baumannii]
MAILTAEKFENLNRDIEDTGKAINIIGIITPRYGDPFKSLPLVSKEAENRGGYISAPTLTALQAIVPSYNWQLARDDSTGDDYRWNPAASPNPKWEPTGRNYLKEAKVDATAKANAAESNAKSYASTQANAASSNIKQSDSVNLHEFTDSEGSVVAAINSNGESVAQDFKGEFGGLNALSKAVETTEAPSLHTFADAGGNVVARLTAAGDFQPQDVVTESGSFNTVAKKVSEYDIQNALSVQTDVEGNILEIIRPDGLIVPSITQVSYGIAEFRAGVVSPDIMNDVGRAIDNNLIKNDAALKFTVTVSPFLADETRHQRMADAVLVGPNRMYVAFSQFSTMSTDQADGRLVGRFVDFDLINQTATISETIPIIGEKIGSLYRHPNFIKLKDRILMIFNGPLPQLIVYESLDNCQTWQEKNRIDTTDGKPWALALNSAVLIEEGRYKGRIVLSLFTYQADGLVGTVYSDDNGVTWVRGQTLHGAELFPNYATINETSLAVDAQQNLIFVIRNESTTPESRYLIFAKSTDGGETLHIFEQTTRTPALACQTGLKQICPQFYDGLPRIIATCPTTGGGNREGFRFRISYDNCMSWAHEYKPFAETLRVGYSTVIPLDQKTYALLYEEGTMNASQSIRLTFLNLAEVI